MSDMYLSKDEIQTRNLPEPELLEYALIPYADDKIDTDTDRQYGLIYSCKDGGRGYINDQFLSSDTYGDYSGIKSWKFEPSKVKFEQDGQTLETLNTKEYVYLVSFVPFKDWNDPGKHTGKVYYGYPITILAVYKRGGYRVLSIQPDGLACARGRETSETLSGEHNDVRKTPETSSNNDKDENILKALFKQKDYIGFLTSDAFRKRPLCEFSSTIREDALICASKVLFPDRDVPIVLDDMRNSLIETTASKELGEIWQNHLGIYRDEIVDACANNALFTFSQPEDNRLICQALNNVRNRDSSNNQYSGLFKRFSLAYDALTPQINLLRIVTESYHKTRVKYLNKYCDWVQNMHTSPMCKDWDAPQKLFSLTELIQATFKIFNGFTLPEATITKIASTYLDTGNFDKLGELLDTIDPRKESSVSTLWQIYQNSDAQTEENVRSVFHLLKTKPDAIGPQFYQKMVALLWDKFHNQTILPESFLRFLAWTLKFDTQYNSVDESISYQFSLIFGQREKQRQLVRSLGTICELLPTGNDPTGNAMYALASYTVYYVAKELGEADLPIQCVEAIDQYGETLVEETLNNLKNSNLHEQSDISVQLNTLRYGRIYKRVLEEHRTAYIRTFMLENHSMQQWEGTLAHLYSAGLYDTFIGVYRHYVEKFHGNRHENNALFGKFVNSHIRLGRFTKSAEIVRDTALADESKNKWLIQILAENFRVNQLSEKAFVWFNDSFTLDSACELLWKQISTSQNLDGKSNEVNSLIAIYCHRKEFCKALYLYSIFQPRFETGYKKLYEAIRESFADLWSAKRANNYYNVIQWSFICLNATDLYDFFCWINQIAIHHFTELENISHPLKYHYDQLRKAPTQRSHWYNLEEFLKGKPDQNLWSIIVCETLLRDKFQNLDATPSGKAIEEILSQSVKHMPRNMIPYILSFLQSSKDEVVCEKIILKLTDILNSSITGPDARDRLFINNPWNATYQKDYANFKKYVLEHTQNQKYIPLLRLLPMELDSKDLEALAKQPNSFRQMIPSLCQNYLSEVNLEETFKYLNDLDQQQFDYHEKQLWEIMRVLFGDDGNLQEKYPLLFEQEKDISQLKADIACILQQYPNKDALYAFARNPNSQWKMIVFSFVFRVMYDGAIYKQPVFELASAEIPPKTMCAFLHYLKTSYTAQLHHNTGFEHFYKVWRYLKLYIVECLLTADGNSDNVNDDHIIAMMQALGHEKSIHDSEYRPFKSAVNQLINKIGWNWDVTKRLLLAICQGDFNWFLEYCSQNRIQLAEKQQGLIQAVLSRLDYREAAQAVYQRYYNALKDINQDTDEARVNAARVGAAVSPYIAIALDSLKGLEKEQQLLLLKPAISRSAGACTYQILQSWSVADIQIPILLSRQFPFQIYKAVRNRLLDRPKQNEQFLEQFAACKQHIISQQDQVIFDSVYAYLRTFRYCLLSTFESKEQNIEKAKQERPKIQDNKGIPQNWLPELQQMDAYMNGEVNTFRPLAINDSSLLSSGDTQYTFIEMLATKLAVAASPQNPLQAEDAVKKHKQYQNDTLAWTERLKNGVSLLVNYPVAVDIKIPSCDELRLEVGLNAIRTDDIGLTMGDKLDIAAELYAGYEGNIPSGNSTMSANFSEVTKCYEAILKDSSLSLSAWVKQGDRIIKHSEWKPSDPRALVLGKLKKSQDSACSNEKRLGIFKACLRSLSNSEPLYRAIENEINRINCGIRLQVSLCGKKNGQVNSTDGFVYYQIYNVGKQKVSLNNVNIMLKKGESTGLDDISKYGSNIEGINELHCKFWTGGRVELDSSVTHIDIRLVDKKSNIVFSDVSAEVCHTTCSQPFAVDDETRYETEYAVKNTEMLFGRESEQKAIITMLKKKRVVTICGPSRIGKTSLMNWIRTTAPRELKLNNKTVITLSFGGEGSCGAKTDYQGQGFTPTNVLNSDGKAITGVPYSDGKAMSEYLLAQTIVHALKNPHTRLAVAQGHQLSRKLSNKIIKLLEDTKQEDAHSTLLEKYAAVNEQLQRENVELWLMLDEFQQVVAQWKNPAGDFANVIEGLADNQFSNIRLILCGSDDLLLHMTSHLASEWKNLLHKTVVPIGPLKRKDFCNMMKEIHDEHGANVLKTAHVTYSGEALEALYKFTGGVAIYGKEIGNVILENIQSHATKRNTIYVSDVVEAVQKLLKNQEDTISTPEDQGIGRVFTAVTNRLGNEMHYLWYMALWLSEHPDQDSFPDSAFSEKKLRNPNEKDRALAVAEARKLIKATGTPRDVHYQFTTIFYYNAFLGTVRGLKEGDIFKITRDRVEELVDIMNELPDDKKKHALLTLKNNYPAAFELFEKNVTHNHYNGTVYQIEGDVTINVQNIITITNTFNTINNILLSGNQQDIQAQLKNLPGVSRYLPEGFQLPDPKDVVTDEQTEEQERQEQVLEKATSKMVSEYLSALVSSDSTAPKEFCAWKQLGMTEKKYSELSSKISSSYVADLILAAKLDYIYSLATTEEEASSTLDFSPAAIMYCKLYEKAIKSYHTSLYCNYFGGCYTGILKKKGERWEYKFKELPDPHAHNEILLGKFYYPLEPEHFNQRWDKLTQKWVELTEADWKRDRMMLWKGDQETLWVRHREIFKEVKEIRNKSAHGKENSSLTKDDLSTLKKLLFEKDGLLHIVELVNLCENIMPTSTQ